MRTELALGLALALAAGACERKTEYAGIGPWHVKRTKLRDATGRCQPTDLADGRKGSWCFGQQGIRVGGQDATVDLYFGGTEPDAKVIEIQLAFRGCQEQPLEQWVRKNFGTPFDERGKRMFLRNSAAFLVAELPAAPGRCTIRLLPRSEEAEVERMRAEAGAKAAPPTPPATP